MKLRILRFASILFTLLLVISSLNFVAFAAPLREFRHPRPDRPEYVAGQILVKFKTGTPADRIRKIHQENETFVRDEIEGLGVQMVSVPQGRERDKITAYTRNPNVEFAELDFVAEALGSPNDSYFDEQWGLNNTGQTGGTLDADIDAPEAWDTTIGLADVRIAILDTGIDQDHEDLKDKIVGSVNFTNSDTADDRYGHGTHVAGIAAASTNNTIGVAGVGYQSSLLNVKVLNDEGAGYYSWIADGIVWATNNSARVINMSLGGGQRSKTLESAVNYAWSKGVILAAAAGNSNNPSPTYPARYEKCIAVAATNDNDLKADFSSYGDWVDVAAPGVSVFSTWNDNDSYLDPQPVCDSPQGCYKYGSGTSMSTPHVAGIAALVWATGLGTDNQAVRDRIEQTADAVPRTGSYWIWGRVNAYNAVAPSPPPENQPPVAAAGPDQSVYVGNTVTFDGSASSDPDGTIVSYAWDFGDGSNGSGATVNHVYTTVGTYTVTLTVTDNGGLTGSDTAVITISEKPTTVKCWSGSNGYLYQSGNQAKKFCKCAQGNYGYNSYSYAWGRKTVYQYKDAGDNEKWEVTSRSSNTSVYRVVCTDGKLYPTNQDYYWPK